jgi:putative membrane protein insertion efficiency factor
MTPDTKAGVAKAGALQGGAAQLGIGMVRVYQWTVRPLIGAHCRFWPSCSEYAVEALRVHGAARGTVMAAKRILRCNPWNEGGVDPVPRFDENGVDRNMGH